MNYLVLCENSDNSFGLKGATEMFLLGKPINPGMMMETYPALSTVNVRELLKEKKYLENTTFKGILFYGEDVARYVVPVFWELFGSRMPPCIVYHGNHLLNSQIPYVFPTSRVFLHIQDTSLAMMDPSTNEEWVNQQVGEKAKIIRNLSRDAIPNLFATKKPYKCSDSTSTNKHITSLQRKICNYFKSSALFVPT